LKRIRKRFTYANVMSSIAVFLVLGGATAFAAGQLGKNSVGTKQLKKNAVTTAKIKQEAVTGAKIKSGTITGSQLNLSSIGTVPSATNASHATNADSAGNANTVGGKSIRWLVAKPDSTIIAQSGGLTITHVAPGLYIVDTGSSVSGHLVTASDGVAGDSNFRGVTIAGPCGTASDAINCEGLAPNANDGNHVLVATTETNNSTEADHSFYLTVY
jgi:hypothetical protein